MQEQLSLFGENFPHVAADESEIDRLQQSIADLQAQQRRTRKGSAKWEELESAIAYRQHQLVNLWQGKPAEEKSIEDFTAGEQVIFSDNSISSRNWHNQRCVVESLNSPINSERLVVRFADGTRLHPKRTEVQKIPPAARDSVEREEFSWVETYLCHGRYLYWRYCYSPSPKDINQTEKIHIPGRSRSIREGRAKLVRDWIDQGKSPQEIAALIRSW